MNISQYMDLGGHMVEMSVQGLYAALLLHGESGLGKTECTSALADKFFGPDGKYPQEGEYYVPLLLGQMEAPDLIGLPRDGVDAHGNAVTIHAKPDWFPLPGTRGIVFLDEENRGHPDTRQAVFQLLHERRIHSHRLPPGWIVIAANNPPTDEYDVQQVYDKAYLARFCHIAFEPTVAEWMSYATDRDADWSIRSLIAEDAKFLGKLSVSLPQLQPTPRSWIMLARLLPGLPPHLEQEVAAGLVGPSAAASWLAVRTSPDRPVRGADVLTKWHEVRDTAVKYTKQLRSDLLKVTFDEIVSITKAPDYAPAPEEIDNLAAFLKTAPIDLAYGYLKMTLIHVKALRRPLTANEGLYSFIVRLNEEASIS